MNFFENKIFHGDCLALMENLPDNSIDFVFCDLPFQITCCEWDKKIDLQKFWTEINRVTKYNAACAMFANGKFVFELTNSNFKNYRYTWVVEKDLATGFLNSKKMPLKSYEDVLIFYRQLPTYNPQYFYSKPYKRISETHTEIYREGLTGHETISEDGKRYPRDVLKFVYPKKGLEKFHPTQKPIDLLEYFIKTYTNEGEIVLDATIGRGSTAVAAINCGRKFVGYEIDEKYFEIAQKRINEALAKKQQELF